MSLFRLDIRVNETQLLKTILTVWSKCIYHGLWMVVQMRIHLT